MKKNRGVIQKFKCIQFSIEFNPECFLPCDTYAWCLHFSTIKCCMQHLDSVLYWGVYNSRCFGFVSLLSAWASQNRVPSWITGFHTILGWWKFWPGVLREIIPYVVFFSYGFDHMQRLLGALEAFCQSSGQTINVDKAKYGIPKHPTSLICGRAIPYARTWYSHILWDVHISRRFGFVSLFTYKISLSDKWFPPQW